MNDLRYAARTLSNAPVFTTICAGLLMAGIGASTVIFSVADVLWLRPLPVVRPQELVRLVQKSPQLGARSSFVYPLYEALRDHSTTLSAVFGEEEFRDAMNEPRPAEQIRVSLVTPEFFDSLGVAAWYGRTLTPADAKEDLGMIPAVLSYGFWRRRFGGNPKAIGRSLRVHGHKFLIAGVMPRDFNGTSMDTSPDVRLPLRAAPLLIDWDGRPRPASELDNLALAGRLKPGITRAQALGECFAMWRAATTDFYQHRTDLLPGSLENELKRGLDLDPLDRGTSILRDRFGNALALVTASAGLLLLMVCANVAGLLIARGAARGEEIAVRLALGATRPRLIRQLLTESCLVAALGSAGAALAAVVAIPLLVRSLPPLRDLYTARVDLSAPIGVNWRVLLFSVAISGATVLLFGLAPSVAASRANLDSALRGARASRGWRGRRALIVFQIALCTVLLAAAALLARTLHQLRAVDPGFDRDHIVTFTVDPSLAGYTPGQARSFRLALMERVRELSGVSSVAVAGRPLMRGSGIKATVVPLGQRPELAGFMNSSVNSVTPGYFDTMGMRILSGRGLTPADERNQKPPRSVVVNQAFAAKFFSGENAIGRRFGITPDSAANVIVGVASDAKYRSLREPMIPTFYSVWTEDDAQPFQPFQLEVRTSSRPQSIIEPVRRVLAALDPGLPLVEVEVMADEVEASAAGERITALLASVFGAAAALLAAIGIYGLLAYAVTQRRREIGIRVALGAKPGDIGGMIAREALLMVSGGVAAGLGAAAVSAHWIRSLLYGVGPSDPRLLALAALLVCAVAAIATAIPATNAMRVQPASVLRHEQ
jgi:predicted permease